MLVEFTIDDHTYSLCNVHSLNGGANNTAVEVDGEPVLATVNYEPHEPSIVQLLGNTAGIWGGEKTRIALDALAEEMLKKIDTPTGADYDRVISQFEAEGHRGE